MYPGADDDTPVSAVWKNRRIQHIASEDIITALRVVAKAIGGDKLGFKISEIATLLCAQAQQWRWHWTKSWSTS